MAEFECRLKKYQQMKDLTQEQLAEKVGVRQKLNNRIHALRGFYYHEQKYARCNISRTFAC